MPDVNGELSIEHKYNAQSPGPYPQAIFCPFSAKKIYMSSQKNYPLQLSPNSPVFKSVCLMEMKLARDRKKKSKKGRDYKG